MIGGSGVEDGVKAFMTHQVQISFNDIESIPLSMPAFENDPFYLSEYLGTDIHGILGFEFFNSFIVKINYQSQIIQLNTSIQEIKTERYQKIKLLLENKKPYILSSISLDSEKTIQVKLLVDSGAGFPLALETYSDSSIVLPQKHLSSELGIGLNGIITGSIARVDLLQLDKFSFSNIVTSFPDYLSLGSKLNAEERNGSIGNFILNRFTVIFDYANETMYLKPNAKINTPFPYDRTGIEVIATGDLFIQFIVKNVKVGSPAEEHGIMEGDEIDQINFRPITSYTLTQIDHLFSDPNSEDIVLRLKRNDEFMYVLLEMKDLI